MSSLCANSQTLADFLPRGTFRRPALDVNSEIAISAHNQAFEMFLYSPVEPSGYLDLGQQISGG